MGYDAFRREAPPTFVGGEGMRLRLDRQAMISGPISPETVSTRGVLAGAYVRGRANPDAFLKHSTADGRTTLCKKIKPDNLADEYSDPAGNDKPPTCPTCLARDPRFK